MIQDFSMFNWVDYVIFSIIGISTLMSLIRGFVREALSLSVWVIAFIIAFKFSDTLAPSLHSYITSDTMRFVAAFALLMLGSLIIGAIITHFLSMLIHKTGLSGTDRLLGILFGLVRGILLVVIMIMIGKMSNLQRQSWWVTSQMIPQFQGLVLQLEKFLPEKISNFPAFLESQKKQLQEKVKTAVPQVGNASGDSSGVSSPSTSSNILDSIKQTIQGENVGGLPAIIQN